MNMLNIIDNEVIVNELFKGNNDSFASLKQ